jgi:hypothetical protein
MASDAIKLFSQLIYFINKVYKCCTFSTVRKCDSTLNCLTLQHNNVLFLYTLMGHTKIYILIYIAVVKECFMYRKIMILSHVLQKHEYRALPPDKSARSVKRI